ncbi:MAG: 50S ribosomal protein L23 [Promethearchaeota archaeon]
MEKESILSGKLHRVVHNVVISEKLFDMIENENKLAFIVDRRANKREIKKAVEILYDIKVDRVNTLILPDGRKKAYVRLADEEDASDLAAKLGMF